MSARGDGGRCTCAMKEEEGYNNYDSGFNEAQKSSTRVFLNINILGTK